MTRERASTSDRAYFDRIATAAAALEDEQAPRTLAEMFDRMAAMRERLGALAHPGVAGEDADELRSHLRIYELARERA